MDISRLLIDGKQGDELPLTEERASGGQVSYSPHTCASCGSSFLHSKDFERHQKSHETGTSQPWSCRTCSGTFETLELLEYHRDGCHGRAFSSPFEDPPMILHSSDSTEQPRSRSELPSTMVAPSSRTTRDGIRWREPEFAGEPPYRSQSTDDLTTQYKPRHMCCFDDCGKGFITATALEQHQIRHSGSPNNKQGSAQPSRSRTHLTWADKKAMCQYHKNNLGEKQINIAMKFGVERSTVSKVLRQKEMYLNHATDPVCVECGGTGLVNFSKCRSCVNAAAARLRHQRAKRGWEKKTKETSPGIDTFGGVDIQQGSAHSPRAIDCTAYQGPSAEDSRMSAGGSPSSKSPWEGAKVLVDSEDDPDISQAPHSSREQWEMLRRASSVASASSTGRLDTGLSSYSGSGERRRSTWIDIACTDSKAPTTSNQA